MNELKFELVTLKGTRGARIPTPFVGLFARLKFGLNRMKKWSEQFPPDLKPFLENGPAALRTPQI